MLNYCPITSFHNEYKTDTYCAEQKCAWWDEKNSQCCIKTLCAAAGKPSGESGISKQAEYVYSVSPTPAVIPNSSGDWVNPNPYITVCNNDKSYVLDFDEGGYK